MENEEGILILVKHLEELVQSCFEKGMDYQKKYPNIPPENFHTIGKEYVSGLLKLLKERGLVSNG